jgi:hypothetical protein
MDVQRRNVPEGAFHYGSHTKQKKFASALNRGLSLVRGRS